MRIRVGSLLGAVLLLVVAGCGGSSPSTAPSTSDPSPSASSPSASDSPSVPASPPPAAKPYSSAVRINEALSLGVPPGWLVERQPIFYTGQTDGYVCLHPRDDAKVVFGCAGIGVYFGPHLPGAHQHAYAPDRPDGWYSATDVQVCPFGPAKVGGHINGIDPLAGFDKGLRPVGAHKADWNRWSASCGSGERFHPQAWFLPKSHVVIFDYLSHPETGRVLATAKFASDGVAMPAMPTYLSAHLVSQSGSTLTVQPFHTYGNDAEGKAYAKAHGLGYPFSDDYRDVDTGAPRSVVITSSTDCTGSVILTHDSASSPVSCTRFAGHKGLTMGIWLNAGTSTIENLAELYRP